MEDAFGKKLEVGSRVLYSTSGSAGTCYHIGEVTKLYPSKESKKFYSPPDRVAVKVLISKNRDGSKPILYASNVVLLPVEE